MTQNSFREPADLMSRIIVRYRKSSETLKVSQDTIGLDRGRKLLGGSQCLETCQKGTLGNSRSKRPDPYYLCLVGRTCQLSNFDGLSEPRVYEQMLATLCPSKYRIIGWAERVATTFYRLSRKSCLQALF